MTFTFHAERRLKTSFNAHEERAHPKTRVGPESLSQQFPTVILTRQQLVLHWQKHARTAAARTDRPNRSVRDSGRTDRRAAGRRRQEGGGPRRAGPAGPSAGPPSCWPRSRGGTRPGTWSWGRPPAWRLRCKEKSQSLNLYGVMLLMLINVFEVVSCLHSNSNCFILLRYKIDRNGIYIYIYYKKIITGMSMLLFGTYFIF